MNSSEKLTGTSDPTDKRGLVKPVDAVILAGGMGSRLQDVVSDRPKPLAMIRGRPFLDILIDDLLTQGFRRIILCVGHQRQQIIDRYVSRTDAEFLFSEERTLLGTGGAVRHAANLIASDPFLLLNGDSYCQVDFRKLLAFHHQHQASATIVVTDSRGRIDGGNIVLGADGRIQSFQEKTAPVSNGPQVINAGVYALSRRLPFSWHQPDPLSLEREVFPLLAAEGQCHGFLVTSEVIDIGTPERYAAAQNQLPGLPTDPLAADK